MLITIGVCQCNSPYYGRTCFYKACEFNCHGETNGSCDRQTGTCFCKEGRSGTSCGQPSACESKEESWARSFDQKGWSTCPVGYAITGLRRSACEAIYCIESAICANPCEITNGGVTPLTLSNCYSENWYSTMDRKGWSKCTEPHFLAGLYRSTCDSLFCIEQALCCIVDGAIYQLCGVSSWVFTFAQAGVARAPEGTFITGFERGSGHNLSNIESISYCTIRR